MNPFYRWGSLASRIEPLRECSLIFTTKYPEIPGTYFISLRRMKDWVNLGATLWFWTQRPLNCKPCTLTNTPLGNTFWLYYSVHWGTNSPSKTYLPIYLSQSSLNFQVVHAPPFLAIPLHIGFSWNAPTLQKRDFSMNTKDVKDFYP